MRTNNCKVLNSKGSTHEKPWQTQHNIVL